MSNPDKTIVATAMLVENLAKLMPIARAHARLELMILDGSTDHTPGASNPDENPQRRRMDTPTNARCAHNIPNPDRPDELIDCGRRRPCGEHDAPVTMNVVERSAERRIEIERWIDDIEQQCKLIAVVTLDALRAGNRLLGHRVKRAHEVCRDGQVGKDGTIDWGDPTCHDGASKSGLCSKHYQSWYRWRKAHGIDTAAMFEPTRL